MIDKCPYCGHNEYYKLFRLRGKGVYHSRFDGKTNDELEPELEIDNSGMYDNFTWVELKTMYCSSSCQKPIRQGIN